MQGKLEILFQEINGRWCNPKKVETQEDIDKEIQKHLKTHYQYIIRRTIVDNINGKEVITHRIEEIKLLEPDVFKLDVKKKVRKKNEK
jgi:hypothetical protein